MKRFFRNLKTLAMVAVVGFATLNVSCYDDTELREGIAANTESITDLTARVEALEIKLGNEVNALKALIADEIAKVNDAIEAVEDKIVIAGAEQGVDGSWILTLASGEEVTVYPAFTETNEGMLTTVKENGVYYWAQIVGGTAVKLTDANGNGYAVHHATIVPEVPECHAEPQVRVNEAGYTEVSFDGGQTWHQLGGGDAGLFQSVVVTDNSITFVLNGGQEFTVTLPEVFNFSVEGNKVYVKAEETLVVNMKVTAIKDLTVIAKPEGWKVAINGNKLEVTAPAQDALDAATAELAGAVKVLGLTAEGKAVMGKLFVSAGKGITISIGEAEVQVGYDENWDPVYELAPAVIFDNQLKVMVEDWYTGEMVEQAAQLIVGIFPKGEYTMETLAAEVAQGWYGNYPYYTANVYYEGETAFALNGFFQDNWSGDVLPYEVGGSYIIFATPYTSAGYNYAINPEDIVIYEYVNRSLDVKEVSASAFDVQISVNVAGYDNYRVYFSQAQYDWVEEWNMCEQWGDPFGFAGTYKTFEGSLFQFGFYDDGYSVPEVGLPGTLYSLVLVPEIDGEYSKDNAVVYYFKTADAVAGGSVTPVFTEGATDYSTIKVNVDATGSKLTYYNWFTEANYEQFTSDDELFEAVHENGYVKSTETFSLSNSGMTQGASRWLVAFSIDANGQYGAIAKQKFTTKVFQFSDTMTISIDEFKFSDTGKEAWVKVSVSGNTADIVQYRYGNVNNTFSWTNTYGGSYEAAAQYIATVPNAYYGPKFVDPAKDLDENGYIHLTNLAVGEEYHFVIIAMDANGSVTPGVGYTYTPELTGELIYADEAGYAAPVVTIGEKDIYEMYGMKYADYTYTITPVAGTARFWYRYMDEEYETTYNNPWSLVTYMVTNTGTSEWYSQVQEGDAPLTVEVWEAYVSTTTHIYVTWNDGNGNYYECVKVPVFTAEEVGE